jgi:hypothetical protein
MAGFYRTRPISVEAFQWDGVIDPEDPSGSDLGYNFGGDGSLISRMVVVAGRLQVSTANGTVMANAGDWIVYWKSTSQTLEVVDADTFRKRFEVDQRTARIRGWQEPPEKKRP